MLEQVEPLVLLAYQYGPFLFAIIFIFFITTRTYKQYLQHPRSRTHQRIYIGANLVALLLGHVLISTKSSVKTMVCRDAPPSGRLTKNLCVQTLAALTSTCPNTSHKHMVVYAPAVSVYTLHFRGQDK